MSAIFHYVISSSQQLLGFFWSGFGLFLLVVRVVYKEKLCPVCTSETGVIHKCRLAATHVADLQVNIMT